MFCLTKGSTFPALPLSCPPARWLGSILRDFRQQKRHLWEINILFWGPGVGWHEARTTGARRVESRGCYAWAALELSAATLQVHAPKPLPIRSTAHGSGLCFSCHCCRWQLLFLTPPPLLEPLTALITARSPGCPCSYPRPDCMAFDRPSCALRNCAFFITFFPDYFFFLRNYSLHYCISYCWYTRI